MWLSVAVGVWLSVPSCMSLIDLASRSGCMCVSFYQGGIPSCMSSIDLQLGGVCFVEVPQLQVAHRLATRGLVGVGFFVVGRVWK